jgi:hypothetical protein
MHCPDREHQWNEIGDMSEQAYSQGPRTVSVIGPDGERLRLSDLPPPNTRRWVIRRKAEVVTAVLGGLLTVEEALARYSLTEEEFDSWRGAFGRHGMAGLRTTWRG